MLRYILKRIIIFLPTLIAISLLAFIISINAPGDPVERMVSAAQSGGEVSSESANLAQQKKFWREKLGLDLPVFYFAIGTIAESDTLYRVYDKNEKNALARLISQFGNWEDIAKFYNDLFVLENNIDQLRYTFKKENEGGMYDKLLNNLNTAKFEVISMRSTYNDELIQHKLQNLNKLFLDFPDHKILKESLARTTEEYAGIKQNASPWKTWLPAIHFYPKNQYHRWIFGDGNWLTGKNSKFSKGVFRGDFGTSYLTKEPISKVIASKIVWSMFFAFFSTVLAYIVSIPLGIKSAVKKNSMYDRITTVGLFILYSMPNFWVATLLLMTFANPDVLLFFPASGVKPPMGYPEDANWFHQVWISLPFVVLPMFCYTYSSFAFLSRTMRVGMLEVLQQDYVRTARAKGLAESVVINKHALKNALIPIITVFANIFPLAMGGSVILEFIFTIPGMGLETFMAIQNQNYPMIVAVFTITGFLTLVGYLISDILYALVDPRITYS